MEEVTDQYHTLKQRRLEAQDANADGRDGKEGVVTVEDVVEEGEGMERLSSRQRALRSAAGGLQEADNASDAGTVGRNTRSSADALQSGINLINGVASKGSRGGRKGGANGSKEQTLDYALPESSMRADFVEIVRDLQNRAMECEKSRPRVRCISFLDAMQFHVSLIVDTVLLLYSMNVTLTVS